MRRMIEFKGFSNPIFRRLVWVLFAIVFYKSGLTATVWLLEPEQFNGGFDWLWLLAFPILFPLFFVVNRHLGCASGACNQNGCDTGVRTPPGH